jgi:hypothetical protein
MTDSPFYDDGALRHLAINLFNGWGYNFYRKENQLRADDQLIRAKAAWLAGLAAQAAASAETEYRRVALPPPSRAKPFPDPEAVAGAQALERLARAIAALPGRIQAQPVPENDRMTERYRLEAATLETLGACDSRLVGQCELLRSMVEGRDGPALLADIRALEGGVAAIEATLHDRAAVLQDRAAEARVRQPR